MLEAEGVFAVVADGADPLDIVEADGVLLGAAAVVEAPVEALGGAELEAAGGETYLSRSMIVVLLGELAERPSMYPRTPAVIGSTPLCCCWGACWGTTMTCGACPATGFFSSLQAARTTAINATAKIRFILLRLIESSWSYSSQRISQ